MSRARILLFALCACGSSKSGEQEAPVVSEACKALGAATAEIMVVGFERGGPIAKYVRAEYIAAVSKQAAAHCAEGDLPGSFVACLGDAETAADADACEATLSPSVKTELRARLRQMVIDATAIAFDHPATLPECATAAVVISKRVAEGGVQVTPTDITNLCREDRWDAAYVRCVGVTEDATGGCKSKSTVEAGLRKLISERR